MENTQRLAVLAEMGVDWYVPLNFDASVFESEITTLERPDEQLLPVAVAAHSAPVELIEKPNKPAAALALKEDEVAVAELQAEPLSEAVVKAEVSAVEPFNWLIAEAGFVHFVCDIKQARLAPVWHAAANELLGDIAIALGVPDNLSSDHFSWPPSEQNGALSDADLPDFLSEYLAGADDALYILMGETAQMHASATVLKGKQHVKGVALGQLFRQPEHKQGLWQQLKPFRR